ncbi:MAG: LysM domain-containing protein [Candidatus Paceibacterota bacterium]
MSDSLSGPSGGGEVLIEENALISGGSVSSSEDSKPKIVSSGADEISVYLVREGDTLSQIAEMFGVKVSTVRGFNNIKQDSDLKPGQELLILPVDGVLYKVEKGDTL